MLAYSSSFSGVFVADDEDAIVRNESIQSLQTAFDTPRNTTVAGRPVLNLSFALNYAVAAGDPLDPWGYHALNLAIHLASALALFGVVRRTLASPALNGRMGDAAVPFAFAIALLWVVHPLHTGAVTYIVQRAESLMGLFLLLTLYAALRADEQPVNRQAWVAASIVACAMGMATKEVMVVAPLIVALWLWILRPGELWLTPERRTLLSGLALSWVILAGLVILAPRDESVGFALGGWTWLSYLRTQAEVIVHYVRLSIVPAPLVFMYSWPPAESCARVLPEFLVLSVAALSTVVLAIRRHPAALPGAWFFLILAPSSSVLPIATEVAAEHRMYLPLAAVITVVVITVAPLLVRFTRTSSLHAALLLVVALALGATTYARNKDYVSIEALMRDTVENSPSNLRARVIYGGHLLGLERYPEAETQLRAALTLPERVEAEQGLTAMAHMYLGSALAAQGRVSDAIPHLERALELSPSLSETHAFLGEAYASQGRLAESAASFERAVELMPNVPAVLSRAASVLDALASQQAQTGGWREAVATSQRALGLARLAGEQQLATEIEQRLATFQSRLRERR